jgi:hypothetical protein
MPDQPDKNTNTPEPSQESKESEYMRGGKGRKDDVRGSRIYPASSPDAPADAEVRSPGDFVGHSKPPRDE